jgi:hypothetical protein
VALVREIIQKCRSDLVNAAHFGPIAPNIARRRIFANSVNFKHHRAQNRICFCRPYFTARL